MELVLLSQHDKCTGIPPILSTLSGPFLISMLIWSSNPSTRMTTRRNDKVYATECRNCTHYIIPRKSGFKTENWLSKVYLQNGRYDKDDVPAKFAHFLHIKLRWVGGNVQTMFKIKPYGPKTPEIDNERI